MYRCAQPRKLAASVALRDPGTQKSVGIYGLCLIDL
jgi:hypothetical protein